MPYYVYPLIDYGYATPDGSPLPEINGLDNRNEDGIDLRFKHLGYTYPEGAEQYFDRKPDRDEVLALFEDGASVPDGGEEKTPEEALAYLKANCGWPDEAVLRDDGLPWVPKVTNAV